MTKNNNQSYEFRKFPCIFGPVLKKSNIVFIWRPGARVGECSVLVYVDCSDGSVIAAFFFKLYMLYRQQVLEM